MNSNMERSEEVIFENEPSLLLIGRRQSVSYRHRTHHKGNIFSFPLNSTQDETTAPVNSNMHIASALIQSEV